jgi:hypothetical protein
LETFLSVRPRSNRCRSAALAVEALEVADEEHAQAGPRRNAGASAVLMVRRAELLIEPGPGQHGVELGVERVRGAFGPFRGGDEAFGLPGLAFSKCHTFARSDRSGFNLPEDFSDGLLTPAVAGSTT